MDGSAAVSESVNPATGAVLGRWADGGEAEARAAIAAARRAFGTSPWSRDRSLRHRALSEMADHFDAHAEELGTLVTKETARSSPRACSNQPPPGPRSGTQLPLESSSDRYRGSMSEGARQDAEKPPVKWLTAAEVDSWLSVVRLMTWLPWSIDQQLQRDSNLGMVEYQVLAMLSKSPKRTLRMSSLAEVTNASLSRLSHLVKRLEGRGLVRREPDPADGRFTNAILTDEGFQALADAAPGHVAHVRSLVIDVLSPEQLRRLGLAADRIMSRIDTSEIN